MLGTLILLLQKCFFLCIITPALLDLLLRYRWLDMVKTVPSDFHFFNYVFVTDKLSLS